MLLLSGPHRPRTGVAFRYRIKPSDVAVPPDVKLGDYQRTIRPFENWTLICDENLKARKKVCNVSQIIEDRRQDGFQLVACRHAGRQART